MLDSNLFLNFNINVSSFTNTFALLTLYVDIIYVHQCCNMICIDVVFENYLVIENRSQSHGRLR